MAAANSNPRSNAQKPMAKLSSGILGMKFMQKDEPSGSSPEPASRSSVEPEKPSGFQREKDPGEWSLAGSKAQRQSPVPASSETVGFVDMFSPDTIVPGRRSYGSQPKTMDPEQMADSYSKPKRKKGNKKESSSRPADKGTSPPSGKKRPSESNGERSVMRKRSKTRMSQ